MKLPRQQACFLATATPYNVFQEAAGESWQPRFWHGMPMVATTYRRPAE